MMNGRYRAMVTKAGQHVRYALMQLACKILLPIATNCKVCNILRGMLLGFFLGTFFGAVLFMALVNLIKEF